MHKLSDVTNSMGSQYNLDVCGSNGWVGHIRRVFLSGMYTDKENVLPMHIDFPRI